MNKCLTFRILIQKAPSYRSSILLLMMYLWCLPNSFAQPSNDNCSGAISLGIADNFQSCVWTDGNTFGVIDAANVNGPTVCGINYYRDDVWYKISIPVSTNHKVLKVKLDRSTILDQPLIDFAGMAIYLDDDCSSSNTPYLCAINFLDYKSAVLSIDMKCLTPGQEILVRVWSAETTGNWQDGEGFFRIGAYFDDIKVPGKILWGSNGEGSFDGSLNGWTSNSCNNLQLWSWSNDTMCTKGLYSAGLGKIFSLTACDGAACFDADYYDTGGTEPGKGPCPGLQTGTLESPNIDLSLNTSGIGVNLVFTQALRQFESLYYVDYSFDEGVSWSSIQINTEEEDLILYSLNGPAVNNTRKIYIADAKDKDHIKIRFRYEANYYYWIIDDVYITEVEKYNLRVNNSFSIAPYKIWQRDQISGFGGMAEVENIGHVPAEDARLKLIVTDYDDISLWADSIQCEELVYGVPGNVILNDEYITSANPNINTFKGKYIITQDSADFDISDNEMYFDWLKSGNTMSKDNIGAERSGVKPSTAVNFTWGNIYHIINNKDSKNGLDYNCYYVKVGINNPEMLYGARVWTWVYKWDNANNDDIVQDDEKTTVGFGLLDFGLGEKPNTIYTIPVFDFVTQLDGCLLEPNTDYIIAVQYQAPPSDPDLACFIMSDPEVNYTNNYLRDLAVNPGNITYHHVLDIGNTGILKANSFNNGPVPVVRMVLGHDTISSNISTVRGKLYVDLNCDSIVNGNDKGLPHRLILDKQTGNPLTSSNYFGNYLFPLEPDESLDFTAKGYPGYTVFPEVYKLINDNPGVKYQGYDFRMCPDSNFHNVKVSITGKLAPRPGFIHSYKICFENIGPLTENVTLSFYFEGGQGDDFTTIVNAAGGIVNGHTITWNIADLELFDENCINIDLKVDPGTPIGTQLLPHVTINLNTGITDIALSDNEDVITETVVGSIDPNDKSVSKKGFTSAELEKGVSLDYIIRFQNTGNYPATFIEVYDTLVNTLDLHTFEMLSASHDYTLTFPKENILKWRFDNINLPDSTSNESESHGYIKFRINTMPHLTTSDVISNSAAIYFDFNQPVITNSIKTVFVVKTHSVGSDNNLPLEVYPNPVTNLAVLKYNIKESMNCIIELRDASGRVVFINSADKLKGEQMDSIDMSDYSSGVYFLKVYTNRGYGEAKVIRK